MINRILGNISQEKMVLIGILFLFYLFLNNRMEQFVRKNCGGSAVVREFLWLLIVAFLAFLAYQAKRWC